MRLACRGLGAARPAPPAPPSLQDVPLLGQLLLAGGPAAAGERRWCAQLLLAGLRGADDASLYRRKHVPELAMALHDSSGECSAQSSAVVAGAERGVLGLA